MGVSPWNANGQATKPQRGDRKLEAGAEVRPNTTVQVWRIRGGALPMLVGVCRPVGALLLDGAVVQGLTPLATDCRPFGTEWGTRICSSWSVARREAPRSKNPRHTLTIGG